MQRKLTPCNKKLRSLVMRPTTFNRQCTAKSKRSGCRCKNYACRDRETCRMHGGKSLRGADHPNFRHGRCSKLLRGLRKRLGFLQPRPVNVHISLIASPLEEIGGRLKRPRGRITPLEHVTVGEWMRALRAARRMLAEALADLRAEAVDSGLA
jgi:hypothetical protein